MNAAASSSNLTYCIEIFMAVIMAMSVLGFFVRAFIKDKGIGARSIQFTCISLLIPGIIILSMEKILTGETVATLMGGLAGYVLSGIGNYDKNKSTDE